MRGINMDEDNEYVKELKKFIKKDVVVKDIQGNVYTGQCRAINYMHLHIVLMTDQKKIIIKNPQVISRDRETPTK